MSGEEEMWGRKGEGSLGGDDGGTVRYSGSGGRGFKRAMPGVETCIASCIDIVKTFTRRFPRKMGVIGGSSISAGADCDWALGWCERET